MNAHEAFTQGEEEATRTAGEWLVMASKAAANAEQAQSMGDLVMSKRYQEQSSRYYDEAEKCENRARWYRGHKAMYERKEA